jgi:ATP citrate (pro-S)-lyase
MKNTGAILTGPGPVPQIICIGNHQPIIQSILDFDHMIGRTEPSIKAIVAGGRKFERYFFGEREVAIPVVGSVHALNNKAKDANFFLNVTSGRRAYESTMELLNSLEKIQGGVLFAENMPEQHATKLIETAAQKNIWIIGPASVGLLIPGYLKLGAIAGVDYAQLKSARATIKGNVAVFSASGGMTNELIWNVTKAGHCLSFALSFGGERFPIFSPADAFLEAEADEATESIVYYGELGGDDEYELVRLKKEGKLTKPVFAFIAGTISDLFEEPPQFGHAKAMAKTQGESAQAKREALREVGIQTPDTFAEFLSLLNTIPMHSDKNGDAKESSQSMDGRKKSLFMSSVSREKDGKVEVLGSDLTELSEKMSFAELIVSMFLGKKIQSKEVIDFTDIVLKLLVDHGPHVSGAVNTMITARAGRDMVSSLASGILTIGPRFGGAINEAAHNWFTAVEKGVPAQDFVESFAAKKQYISGIGHKKYRTDNPDPRVAKLLTFVDNLEEKKYTTFAQSVETITTDKKANLILNLDGAVAAIMLDLLSEKEGLSAKDLQECIDTEFFNALFILPRSAGFIAHFLDQKRLDEGLFRLPEDEVMFAQ